MIAFVVSNAEGSGNSTSITQINLPWIVSVALPQVTYPTYTCTSGTPLQVTDVGISGFPSFWTFASFFFFKIQKTKPSASWKGCSSSAAQLFLLGRPGPQKVSTWLSKVVFISSPFLETSTKSHIIAAWCPNLFTLNCFFLSQLQVRAPGCAGFLSALSFSYSWHFSELQVLGKMLFLCVYQLHWCGQKGIHTPFTAMVS